MRAGKLRHRVTIQQTTETRESTMGGVIDTWGTFATRYASVSPLTGREYFTAQQHASEVTHEVRLRYLSGVTTKMRVLHDGRTFDIESIANTDERDRETVLLCKERH